MKNEYRTVRCLFACGLVLALENISQAFDYNFESDFSKTDNTDGSIWSYRWKDSFTRDGNYALLPYFNSRAWYPSASDSYPVIGFNDSGGPLYDPVQDPGHNYPWPNGMSLLHPGAVNPTGQDALAVVSWLSPFSGTVNILMRIMDLDDRTNGGGNGVEYYADNGSAAGNFVTGTIPNGGDTGFFWISDVPVSVGDRLNFIIGPDGNNVRNDSTRMFVEITTEPVPEPSALALLALGGLALLWRKRS